MAILTQNNEKTSKTSKSRNIGLLTEDKNSKIDNLSNYNLEIKKLQNWNQPIKLYYNRPTFLGMVLEERPILTQNYYSANTIYNGNIDGQIEYQILSTFQEMTMMKTMCRTRSNSSLCRTRSNRSNHVFAQILVAGFTDKDWWDHYLDEINRNNILYALRNDDDKIIIKDKSGNEVPDAISILIFDITNYFI